MYPDIPLWAAIALIAAGVWLLSWSADRFVDGAGLVAKKFGVSPFIIGMVIIGFGTSAPEMAVSALSGAAGHSDLSLGNAYGSNIFNILVILGVTAFISPIVVKRMAVKAGVPLLLATTILPGALFFLGGGFTRLDGICLLLAFAILLPLYCWIDAKSKAGAPSVADAEPAFVLTMKYPWFWILLGLAVLVGSSHLLVWGAVDVARALGVSELLIGLTVVAAGTSLPELASSIASARKGQNDFVIGNIVGSNFFNSMAVVGLAGTIHPFSEISPLVLTRDLPVTALATLALGLFGFNWRNPRTDGSLTRPKAILWLFLYLAYLTLLIRQG